MPPFPPLSSNGKFSVSDARRRIKKHGNTVLFGALNVGASAPNPDTRNFSGKVSWNFKSFRKNKLVFSVRSSLVYLSFKKGIKIYFLIYGEKYGFFALLHMAFAEDRRRK